MSLEGLSILGHSRVKPAGKPVPAINPANGSELPTPFYWASSDDVSRAAELASKAFAEYRRWPAARKANFLRLIASLIETNASPLVERANVETALPPARLQGEIARTCGQLRLFATLIEEGWWVDARIDHANPERKPVPKPDVRSMLLPLGPVAVFSSSNFPFAFSVAGGDTASALAAGCPVIVKPHQGHLGTSEAVGVLIQQAARQSNAPEGLFSLLFGPGRDVGMALVKHPLIKAVGFTGSRAGGRALMDAAAARPEPIPVYAEMGSINPFFILPGAMQQNAEALATGLHGSVTLGVGQFCTNPGLVFIEAKPSAQSFLEKLESLMAATPAGTMLTPSICSEYHAAVEKFSKTPGVRRIVQPAEAKANGQAHATLFATDFETFLAKHELMDEVFGPSTLVVHCGSKSEMLAATEKLEGQLTATIHGTPEDFAASADLIAILETKVGRLVCNGYPTGVEVCHAMNHGGPYPATADGRSTSVGTRAILRFVRPVCYQNFPDIALPDELKESNPLGLWRLVDGRLGKH
jgi:NADP-dependent aldehyde dehydrogenase